MPSYTPSMLVDEHFEPAKEDEDQSLSDSDASALSQASEDELVDGSNNTKRARVPRLYEIKDERHAEAFWNNQSLAEEDSLPMGDRVAALGDDQRSSRRNQDNVKMGLGGSREITFTTRSSATYKEDGRIQKCDMRREEESKLWGLSQIDQGFKVEEEEGEREAEGEGAVAKAEEVVVESQEPGELAGANTIV
ncbi:Nucleolar protein 10-like [Quillaja saponaria]|uniref:Nucleolar protein 10-like n=1 Tax=Quillaja saponaria TaxID=32244 RepID=A0AAD7VDX8_QUISA|nr:Nucleolar protein 10-like [Quillaja saponaria]